MRVLALVLLMTSLATAQVCGPQAFRPIPENYDPNSIVTDPFSGQKLFISTTRGFTHVAVTIKGNVCDPEGAPVTVWRSAEELDVDPNGDFSFEVTYDEAGVYYEDVSATDGHDVRTGTYVVVVTDNVAPILSGNDAAPVLSSTKTRQKALVQIFKAIRVMHSYRNTMVVKR